MKMKWFARSCAVAAMGFAVAAPADLAHAQGTKTQGTSEASAEVADSSVVVVALAPIDTMLPNVQHLARLVGGGSAAGGVASAIRQFTGGLDTSRPAGIFVDLSAEGEPTPIVCLPLSNLEQFFSQLAIFGEPEDLGDGLYTIRLGNPIYLRKSGDWVVAGQTDEHVLNFDPSVTANLNGIVAKYDLRVQVNPQNIPPEVVDFFTAQLELGVSQGMAQQREELDAEQIELAEKNAEQVVNNLKELISGTEKFVFGLAVNRADKKTLLDFGTKFVEGTKFAKQIAQYKGSNAALAGVPQDASAIGMKILQFVSPEEATQMEDSLKAALASGFKDIDSKVEDPATAEKVKQFVSQLAELVIQSVKEGRMESVVNVDLENGLNATAGVSIANGKDVDTAVVQLAKDLGSVQDVKVTVAPNIGTHGGANLHRISIPFGKEVGEKERAILGGDTFNLVLATSPKALHLGIGKDPEQAVKGAIDRVAAKPTTPGEPVKAKVTLSKILTFIKSIESNPVIEAMLETTAAGGDNITIDSRAAERDTVMRITVEDNVLKSIQSATTAARQGGGF